MLRLYLILGAVAAIMLGIGGSYIKGRIDGREAVLAKLQSDRIKVLKDGKEIDNEVLGADDSALCDMLGGCGVQPGTD